MRLIYFCIHINLLLRKIHILVFELCKYIDHAIGSSDVRSSGILSGCTLVNAAPLHQRFFLLRFLSDLRP